MLPSSAIDRIIADYCLTSTPDQAIIFLQIDQDNQCRTGKIMQYNPATGGKSQFNSRLTVLKGRKIIAFPDIDAYHDWLRRTTDFPHLDLKVSDLLEKHATPEDRAAHIDLADWLIQFLTDNK